MVPRNFLFTIVTVFQEYLDDVTQLQAYILEEMNIKKLTMSTDKHQVKQGNLNKQQVTLKEFFYMRKTETLNIQWGSD